MIARVNFAPFAEKMRAERLPEIVIRTFQFYYAQLAAGETGLIAEADIRPLISLPDLEHLPAGLAENGRAALPRTILLKLNGGLGTGMGLEKAKSLLIVKEGLTFLDIIAQQALRSGVPLVLMNSFATRADSLAALARYPALVGPIPLDFVQHKVPKVLQADLAPATWPQDPDLEWCPPGHGDIYTALLTSGMLQVLLEHGYEYAFVSNADNLGATLDPLILGYVVANRLPFLMEVADRTPADRKGGHLAQRAGDGRLLLRESAQCPAEDMDAFQDIGRHRYFNTNNLWLHLPALKQLLDEKGGVLGLPLIRNSKTLDPRDPTSPKVYQLETAMGAAISLFEGAGALRVPRTRFAPVKTCDDLLAVRSDAYVLTEDWRIVPNPMRRLPGPPVLSLDPQYYKLIDDLEARFPFGPPSLMDCERLKVRGDVRFGRDVVCRGAAEVINETGGQVTLADQTVIAGPVHLIQVRCYAGARYPERPVAFLWGGRWLNVAQVVRQARTPEGLRFDVVVEQGERYRLSWIERGDVWGVAPAQIWSWKKL
ncbi:MAG: UTP--glucose-1-phosphate uridylyltransferase [Anaerolineae bacterium]